MEPVVWIRGIRACIKERIFGRVDWHMSERAPDPQSLIGVDIDFDSERVEDPTIFRSTYRAQVRLSGIVHCNETAAALAKDHRLKRRLHVHGIIRCDIRLVDIRGTWRVCAGRLENVHVRTDCVDGLVAGIQYLDCTVAVAICAVRCRVAIALPISDHRLAVQFLGAKVCSSSVWAIPDKIAVTFHDHCPIDVLTERLAGVVWVDKDESRRQRLTVLGDLNVRRSCIAGLVFAIRPNAGPVVGNECE